MNKPTEFSVEDYKSKGKNLSELGEDQKKLLILFDQWQSYLDFLIEGNKDHKTDPLITETQEILIKLNETWQQSRKTSNLLQDIKKEPISIIQYRMMHFIQKRREIRHLLKKDQDNNLNKVEMGRKIGQKTNFKHNVKNQKTKQSSLSMFIKKKK